MNNKLEQDKQIIADAPFYANEYNKIDGYTATMPKPKRSLDDMKRIVELEKKVTNLTKLIKSKNKEIYFLKAKGGDV